MLGVGDRADKEDARPAPPVLPHLTLAAVVSASEALAPIALSVVAQHVAAHVARHHGRDPERPAGLSKVTRTL